MGVTGLWSVVDGVGHPINLETLNNQVIAIDLSLWVNQAIKGFRHRNGQPNQTGVCLRRYVSSTQAQHNREESRTVFVFDGMCPQLKRNTIAKRAEQRVKAVDKSRESSVKVLHKYLSSQLSSSAAKQLLSSESLPSLESSLYPMPDNSDFKICEELNELNESDKNGSDGDSESEDDSNRPVAHSYRNIQNLDLIDVNSEEIKSLPLDIRYEVLTELKAKYKGYRNQELMPTESNDFSKYQMQKLLKKRKLQSKIEQTISELNGQHSEEVIEKFDKKDFYFESQSTAGRLMSDENTRFVFIKKSQTTSSLMSTEGKNLETKMTAITAQIPSTSKSSVTDILHDINSGHSDDKELDVNPINNANNFITNEYDFNSDIPFNELHETIEISDESDVESDQQLNVNNCNKNEIKSKSCEIQPPIDSNLFTKIKTVIEVSSDSDNDFVEVYPPSDNSLCQSLDSSLKETETLELNQKSSQLIEEDDSFDSFNGSDDICIDFNTQTMSLPEKNQFSVETEKTPNQSEPSSSQSMPSDSISREELMESIRDVNKQNRMANKTTDTMMSDCQELLKLFGIPFIVSPTEAEAQCAALEMLGLTDGTITDDSDVLLFGAQTVYKNFFTSSKFVELFKSVDIESRYGLSRSSMICIALLCGSDYTDGVDGVGAVTAAEILSEFPGNGLKPLVDFKDWLTSKQKCKDKRPENSIRAKFLKIRLNDSFPNRVIFDAYMSPTVDNSKEKFLWSMPQLEELRRYASLRFGWSSTKTDSILLPVLKKVNEKQSQMTIDNYFKVQVQPKDTAILSKRLNTAINKLRGKESESTANPLVPNKTNSLSQKVKNQRTKRKVNVNKSKPIARGKKVLKSTARHQTPQEVNLSESSTDSE
ncbi:unnamed protein product [Medioppia subpectinata]|uniref:Uncharacterized protein n=1 Tax=Medioppia subpectinata TaxID=1979941 RepID=A0A7R9KL00_9ACAR|nr:unnamed protein product [Medioppia subpectinata]CAG2104294.1 unnamed protein product [Medioppia subpectinata]